MKLKIVQFTGILFLALVSPAMASAHEPNAGAAVGAEDVAPTARLAAQTVDAFHAALAKGDTATALALLADDALIFEEGGVERSKAEYAAAHLAADAAFSAAVPSTRTRRSGRATGDFAWIATEGRTAGRFRERAVDRVNTETMVLKQVGGQWRIVHIHRSSRTPTSTP